MGWLGITDLHVRNLTFESDDDPGKVRVWFGYEPEIRGVDGPARGRLRRGDVIAAIGGKLITTRDGGYLLARPEPDKPVTVTVRRGGREVQVDVTPRAVCPEDAFLPPAAPAPPAPPSRLEINQALISSRGPAGPEPPRAPAAPSPPAPGAVSVPAAPSPPSPQVALRPPSASPPSRPLVAPRPPAAPAPPAAPLPRSETWFGFGFECRNCGTKDGAYFFSSAPSLFSVDPGSPADEAGLRHGDVLTHVDGLPITSSEGARRFFEAEPGDEIRLTYERDGVTDETEIRAESRPSSRARQLLARLEDDLGALSRSKDTVDARELYELARQLEARNRESPDREHLRYAGTLGDFDLEVRGLDSVHVTVDEAAGSLVIRTLDATVRLTRRPDSPSPL